MLTEQYTTVIKFLINAMNARDFYLHSRMAVLYRFLLVSVLLMLGGGCNNSKDSNEVRFGVTDQGDAAIYWYVFREESDHPLILFSLYENLGGLRIVGNSTLEISPESKGEVVTLALPKNRVVLIESPTKAYHVDFDITEALHNIESDALSRVKLNEAKGRKIDLNRNSSR